MQTTAHSYALSIGWSYKHWLARWLLCSFGMNMKTVRVGFAAATMFALCVGCVGNCLSGVVDDLGCASRGGCASSRLVEQEREASETDLVDACMTDGGLGVDAAYP